MSTPNTPALWYGRSDPARPAPTGGLARRTRALIVTAEAVLAAVVGGVAVRGAVGWTVVGLAVVVGVAVAVLARRPVGSAAGDSGTGEGQLVERLRVLGVPSRSSGSVGVVADGQGFAAGLELDISKGAVLDLATLCGVVAADPSRPSAVQVRLTNYCPPTAGSGVLRRPRGPSVAVHRRLHVLLRLEPAWTSDVVARHGGGAHGSRAALVAAVDRLAARLRRSGVPNRVMDADALNALLAEDTVADRPALLFAADLTERADFERIVGLLQARGPERSVLSLCVDLAGSDQWESFAAVLVSERDIDRASAVSAALLADPAVSDLAPADALAGVLPLGGGPGDLVSVLTLARV